MTKIVVKNYNLESSNANERFVTIFTSQPKISTSVLLKGKFGKPKGFVNGYSVHN